MLKKLIFFVVVTSFLFYLGSCKKAAATHKLSGSYLVTTDKSAITIGLSSSLFSVNDTLTFYDNSLLIINSPTNGRSETTWDMVTGFSSNAAPLLPSNPPAEGVYFYGSGYNFDFGTFERNLVILEYEGDVVYELSRID